MELISVAGTAISGFNFILSLAKTYKDLRTWKERDLEVDHEWLDLAHKQGIIEGQLTDYEWMREERVPTAELKGTATALVAFNENKKIIYKIVLGRVTDAGGRSVLVQKTASQA